MASEVGICNLALQRLGAKRIASLTEDSPNARECNAAYEYIRDQEMRRYNWSFAKSRKVLAADTATPAFDYDYQFELPSDWLRTRWVKAADGDTQEIEDFSIEGRNILCNGTDALYLVYTKREADPNKFDALFIQALAAALALHLVERITQSNTKWETVKDDYNDIIAEAKRTNAIEIPSKKAPVDDWITVRA